MKRTTTHFFLSLIFLFNSYFSFAQYQLDVNILSANTSTTCTDAFSGPDILWTVDINNQGESVYPNNGICFTELPNTQFTGNYNCIGDIPATIEVCFKVFENDHLLQFLCQIQEACAATICVDLPLPTAINDTIPHSISLPNGGASEGTLELEMVLTGPSLDDNNLICDAIDLGTISSGDILGDISLPLYSNLCADNVNEPVSNPELYNEAGVWFTFNSGPNPSGGMIISTINYPEFTSSDIDLEIALFETETGLCDGNLQYITGGNTPQSNDASVVLECPTPNTNYYVLVDGISASRGVFGIHVQDVGVVEGGDLRCDYEDLGLVPEGGSITTPGLRSNYCATELQDPYVSGFVSQHSVWFGFTAPSTGHVLIEAITDRTQDSIGLQVALVQSFSNTCNGAFVTLQSEYDESQLDQNLEATCLEPGRPYWILIDGTGFNSKGIFSLRISDAGDITPRHYIDTTLCAGESIRIANSTYTTSGSYADTIPIYRACDSIVFTNLTVLDPLILDLSQIDAALGSQNNGSASISAMGSTGNFSYLWSTGETTTEIYNLAGDSTYCVTVTDDNNCSAEACITIEKILGIFPTFENDTLLCAGDQNGQAVFSVNSGTPPYNFNWQSTNGQNGTGAIAADDEIISILDLSAGAVEIEVSDAFVDTTFTINIVEPLPLTIQLMDQTNASCFGFCDGALEVQASGGTGTYSYQWSNTQGGSNIQSLCQGTYTVTVSDENGCSEMATYTIDQPLEFIANIDIVQEVSCFEGSNGILEIKTINGNPQTIRWNDDSQGIINENLTTGNYSVTVTNEDGCTATATAFMPQPDAPLEVEIIQTAEVSCFGEEDAAVETLVSGPYTSLTYSWNISNENSATLNNIGAGTIALDVTNEAGCVASTFFSISQPDPIDAHFDIKDITCLNPPASGYIIIDSVSGGTAPYLFSMEDQSFSFQNIFSNLEEGAYNVTVQDIVGCEDTFTANVLGPPELEVNLGEDITINQGESITIRAESNDINLVYEWQPLDSITIDAIEVAPLVSTLYSVQITDTLTHCIATDAIFVFISKDRGVYFPNAFSPNNDGNNDYFNILSSTGIGEVHSFRIFNRQGNLLYDNPNVKLNEPLTGWDGTFNGRDLNAGTYVFMAEVDFLDGQREVFSGDFVLMR